LRFSLVHANNEITIKKADIINIGFLFYTCSSAGRSI